MTCRDIILHDIILYKNSYIVASLMHSVLHSVLHSHYQYEYTTYVHNHMCMHVFTLWYNFVPTSLFMSY